MLFYTHYFLLFKRPHIPSDINQIIDGKNIAAVLKLIKIMTDFFLNTI